MANYENTPDDSRLATFEYTGDVAPIAATVNWMDGTTTIAMIVAEPDISPDTYGVYAGDTHYYTDTSPHNGVTVTLALPNGLTYTTSGNITPQSSAETAPDAQPAPADLSPISGPSYTMDTDLAAPYSGFVLATMPYSGGSGAYYGYSAYITWESPSGEDHITAATVDYIESLTAHHLLIEGDYSYLTAGAKTAVVTVVGFQGATESIDVPINVTDTLTATAAPIDIDELNSGGYVDAAHFTDSDSAAVPDDYTVAMTGLSLSDYYIVPSGTSESDGFDVYVSAGAYTGSAAAITTTISRSDGASPPAAVTNSIVLDGGGQDTFTALPTGSDVEIGNGTAVNLGAYSVGLASLTLTDGDIEGTGTITATTAALESGEIDTNLVATTVTVSGGDYVALLGENTIGTMTITDTSTVGVGSYGLSGGSVVFAGAGTLQALDNSTVNSTIVTTSSAATIDTNGYTIALGGGLNGTNDVVIIGGGTANLSGGNNSGFTGNFVVQSGFVAAGSMTDFGSASGLEFDGGGMQWTAQFNIPSGTAINVGAGGATFDSNSFSVAINATLSGPGGVTVIDSSAAGGGMVTLSPTSGSNSYEGGTMIDGAVAAATDAVFGSGPINFGGGGLLKAIANLAIGRTITTPDDPSASATFDSNSHSVSIDGAVTGNGGLTAINNGSTSGSVTLNEPDDFTGVTTVVSQDGAETLVVGDPLALQDSTVDTSGSAQSASAR